MTWLKVEPYHVLLLFLTPNPDDLLPTRRLFPPPFNINDSKVWTTLLLWRQVNEANFYTHKHQLNRLPDFTSQPFPIHHLIHKYWTELPRIMGINHAYALKQEVAPQRHPTITLPIITSQSTTNSSISLSSRIGAHWISQWYTRHAFLCMNSSRCDRVLAALPPRALMHVPTYCSLNLDRIKNWPHTD